MLNILFVTKCLSDLSILSYHCALLWHYVSSYETLCIEYMTALPRPPSVNEVVTRQVLAAWVRRAELQGVQTISLASAFLLLRRHREIQDERQQAVYENTAVIVMEIILFGLFTDRELDNILWTYDSTNL